MNAAERLLIYGATGYTAGLILDLCRQHGWQPTIAGRNREKTAEIAGTYDLPFEAFALGESEKLRSVLARFDVVLNCAGPFFRTYAPMVEACLATKTHYLDITGEIGVFEGCKAFDRPAQTAEIMVMPGTGFDVVPSDCLAAYLSVQLPEATDLELAFIGLGGGLSRGTATTAVENLGSGGAIRENGRIKSVPNAYDSKHIEFKPGRRQLVATIPWGDVSTAHHSTGIPNIRVYTAVNQRLLGLMKAGNWLGWLLRRNWVKRAIINRIRAGAPGPDREARETGKSLFWGRAFNRDTGRSVEARLQTPEGYKLTAMTAFGIAQKVLAGDFKSGYQTPSSAYGADLILEFDGTERHLADHQSA